MFSILIDSLAFVAISALMPGFRLKTPGTAILVAVLYTFLNWLLFKVALPLISGAAFLSIFLVGPFSIFVFLGLTFAFNVGILILTDKALEDFEMKDMPTAVIASILLTVIHFFGGLIASH